MADEFAAFADEYWLRLVRSAVLMGASKQNAEDAAQAVLTSCFQRWRKVGRMAESPAAYAYRSLVHHLARRPRLVEVVMDPAAIPSSRAPGSPDDVVEAAPVRAALLRLTLEHRAVIVCAYYLDLSDKDTATVLGIPQGTVKSRKSRAIQSLSDHLDALQRTEDSVTTP
jgi:RNA polymerase sigma factor (sigma-70 family)